MSELISGKDVVLALLEGKDLLWKKTEWEDDEKEPVHKSMWNIEELLTGKTVGGEVVEFYLKPRTIAINGIEVPAPFEPKDGDDFRIYYLHGLHERGYDWMHSAHYREFHLVWRTEAEIKQVIAALRSVFKPQ